MKCMNNKYIKIFCIIFVFVIISIYSTSLYGFAEENEITLEERIVNMTSSDIVDESNNVTIEELTHTLQFMPLGINITNEMQKIVPIELLYTTGIHVHMGEEYGFVVVTNESTDTMCSSVLVVNFEVYNETDDTQTQTVVYIENKVRYRVQPILEIFVQTELETDAYIITKFNKGNRTFALFDFAMYASLKNENEPNLYDDTYLYDNDGGDIITKAATMYNLTSAYYDNSNFISSLLINVGVVAIKNVIDPYGVLDYIEAGLDTISEFTDENGFHFTKSEYNSVIENDEINKWWDSSSKKQQHDEKLKYSREVFFNTPEDEELSAFAKVAPNQNSSNCFIDLLVDTEGIPSNSRIEFASSFEIFYHDNNSEYFININEDGEYGLVSTFNLNESRVRVKHTMDEKIIPNEEEQLTDSNKSAYLLDKDGYNIFTFKPQSEDSDEANKQDLFGTYRFYANQKTGQLPGIRMYVFKSKVNGVPLDVKALCKMPKEDILSITSPFYPYLFATHNTSELNAPNYMDVNFVNDQSTDNTYYVLYTYSFDYLGSPTDFYVSYDYRPPQITKGTDSSQFNLTNEQSAYYMFTPTNRGNYTFTISDSQVANVSIYKNQILGQPLSINLNTNSFDVLLENNETYYFKVTNNTPIKDAYGADNAIVTISGSVLINDGDCFTPISTSDGNQDYIVNHQVSTTILAGKSRIYKVEPKGYSGIYALQNSGYTVDWYDDSFNLLDQAFLTAGETYYVEITTNTTVTDTLTIKYLSEEIAFNGSLQVVTNGDKRFYAYVLNATGDNLNNATVNVSTKLNTTEIHNETFVGQNTIVIDLTPIVFASNNTFITTIIIDEDTYNTREVITSIIMTNVTAGNAISGEYVNLQFSQSYSNVVQINVPSTVKVLILNNTTGSLVSTTGFYFNIASSSDPLIIYRKTGEGSLTIKAPSNQNAITSSRDLIFNVNAPLSITGGAGVENGAGSNNDGKSAIITNSNNTVVLNGTARLTFLGGTGGNISGRSFYYSDPAGMGGIALQVGNLVINCGTLTIRGGVGGNGGVGVSGTKGADGVGYQADGRGANGSNGTDGGYGADGGTAGMGLVILGSKCVIYTSNITIKAGKAGDGGKGGAGGAGGAGAPGMSVSGFSGQTAGGDGGNGGRGGTGGDAGLRVPAVNSSDMSKIINNTGVDFTSMFTALGDSGGIGLGGTGGEGGAGGSGGTAWFWKKASDGVAGENGANGSNGIWP